MPMSDKFTPTPEMMDEMVEAAYDAYAHDRRPGVRGQLVTPNDDPMYRAVFAALALAIPMIAEECAKMADRMAQEGCAGFGAGETIAAAIRAKYCAP